MQVQTIEKCRICGQNNFYTLLDLGEQALTGVFPKSAHDRIEEGPLELVKCDEGKGGCGLVQLRHSYAPERMYGDTYGYRSGLNRAMVRHLQHRIQEVCTIAQPANDDLVLDIGSNDGTSLSFYPKSFQRVGMDPSGKKFYHHYPENVPLIPEFFSAKAFRQHFPKLKAKIVTSFAMFYDLDDPLGFMNDIHSILADDGVWAFEQSYLPAMLRANAYDTICHEHLSYYAMKQIHWMTERADLKIIDVETNDTNGGSFCITVAKKNSSYPEARAILDRLLKEEQQLSLDSLRGYQRFHDEVLHHRNQLRSFIADTLLRNKTIYGYGASTKGNVLLQFCGLRAWDLPAIAEVNPDKFGSYTPGSQIPILSEQDVHAKNPDYLIVLPWHFREEIMRRENNYLAKGGQLVFPLPHLDVVGRVSLRKSA